MVNEIETILIGFIGGIIVNVVSYKFQKNIERKEEEEKYRTEYKRNIKAKLNEIIDTWNKELAKDIVDQRKIQNEFDIYSNQLTALISRAPSDFPEDKLEQLRELSTSLRKVKDFRFSAGLENYESFKKECQEITEKAKLIRKQ
jgi:hypothetical protein